MSAILSQILGGAKPPGAPAPPGMPGLPGAGPAPAPMPGAPGPMGASSGPTPSQMAQVIARQQQADPEFIKKQIQQQQLSLVAVYQHMIERDPEIATDINEALKKLGTVAHKLGKKAEGMQAFKQLSFSGANPQPDMTAGTPKMGPMPPMPGAP